MAGIYLSLEDMPAMTESTHSEHPSSDLQRIPTLDGWRGVAIFLVLLDHVTFALDHTYPYPWLRAGLHGVTLFFVLSGFLITSNLLREPVSLKKFYIRRFFRLMPTAWLFLATMLIFSWKMGTPHLTSWSGVRACLLFYRNYQEAPAPGALGVAGHFWSLSIEEQFYLIWPSLLLLFGARRCRWVAGLGAIGIAVFRYAFWNRYEGGVLRVRTEVRADALLVGCLLALLLADPSSRRIAFRVSRWLAAPAAVGFLLGIYFCPLLQPLWESASIAGLIAFTSLHSKGIAGRILEWKPLAWLGTISYSVYVWQEPFALVQGGTALVVVSLGVVMPIVALYCHYFVERPLRRFGRRLAERATPYRESSASQIVAEHAECVLREGES
jgi:peptidoglycan/LPS O-acetylase OafA/YrhL